MRARLSVAATALLTIALLTEFMGAATGTQPSPRHTPDPSEFVPMPTLAPTAPRSTPEPTQTPQASPSPVWEALRATPTPTPTAKPTAKPTPKPKRRKVATHRLTGRASWYCKAGRSICHYRYPDGPGFDAYAAAGPRLRAALGPGWRGRVVLVDGVRVRLVDWCQCHKGESGEKLLDLYYDVFRRVGGEVTVSW